MSDPSSGPADIRDGLLEIDRLLRSIQRTLAPDRDTTQPLEVPERPVSSARSGPLSEILERTRLRGPEVLGGDRRELAEELHELADVQQHLANTTRSLGALLEQYRGALEAALGRLGP